MAFGYFFCTCSRPATSASNWAALHLRMPYCSVSSSLGLEKTTRPAWIKTM